MTTQRLLIILQAMLSDALGSASNLSVSWMPDEEAEIWGRLSEHMSTKSSYSERFISIAVALEADARGWARDLSIRWDKDEKVALIQEAINLAKAGWI